MGKYSGRILTAYISPSGVRVCEGECKNGNPDITKFFVVHGVESYFTVAGSGTAPEIINMAGLVSAIIDECKQRHTMAKRVMVCSDCFGIATDVTMSAGGAKSLMSGDVKSIFSNIKSGASDSSADKMVSKVKWGQTTEDGKIVGVTTTSIGDKYMLKSLVTEFFHHGYEVIYVSGAAEVLTNLWQTEPASFDSQGKVILNVDSEIRSTVFVKDVPVEYSAISLTDPSDLQERILTVVKGAMQKTGRNPLIYLAGTGFSDPTFYRSTIDFFDRERFKVYDLLACPEVDEEMKNKILTGEADPILTPDFTANIAMMMCGFTKQLISLTPSVDFSEVFQKNSKAIAVLALVASVGIFLASLGFSGYRLYKLWDMDQNPSALDSLQSQVAVLTARQNSLTSTIETLTQADTTVLELMQFITVNQSDRVHVVSVDTRDMLTDGLNVDMTVAVAGAETDNQDFVSGSGGGGSAARENIVIRGYAKTGTEAVSFYNRLFNYGLTSDPILNGVERYILPDGDQVYIFEIELGGGE